MDLSKYDVGAVLGRVRGKIKREWSFAFCSAFVIGLTVHAYIFLNNLPNGDGVEHLYSKIDMVTSGRWFLQFACGVSGYFAAPWIIGLLSVFYISIAVVLLVDLFKIKSRLSILLISGFVAAFPAIAATFAFLFTADGYMMAFALSVFAVWLTAKFKWGFLPGAVSLCLAVAIYQSYISVSVVLCIFVLSVAILDGESNKAVFTRLWKSATMGVIGFALYYVILKIILNVRGLELTAYQSIDELNSFGKIISFSEMLNGFKLATASTILFLINNAISPNNLIFYCLIILIILSLSVCTIAAIKARVFRNPFKLILVIVMFVALPASFSCLLILFDTAYYALLLVSVCLLFVFFAVVAEKYLPVVSFPSLIVKWTSVVISAIMIFQFAVTCNNAYLGYDLLEKRTRAIVSDIVDEVNENGGFDGTPVLVAFDNDSVPASTPLGQTFLKELLFSVPMRCYFSYLTNDNFRQYLNAYFNTDCELTAPGSYSEITSTDEYLEMDDDCQFDICEINDVLVIKINRFSDEHYIDFFK